MKKGRLFLVPSPLGPLSGGLPLLDHQTASKIRFWVVENPGPCLPVIAGLTGEKNPEHWVMERGGLPPELLEDLRNVLLSGEDVGLMCDAGLPAIADPGRNLVAAAHVWGVTLLPLTGPSSLFLGLMASGLSGQHFRFLGYLEKSRIDRENQLKTLSKHILRSGETQIFIETPYRNPALLDALIQFGAAETQLCLAMQLHHADQAIRTQSLGAWKKNKPDIQKKQVLFLWGLAK